MKRTARVHDKKSKCNPLVFPARDMLWLIPGAAMFCLCYAMPYFVSLLSSFLSNAEAPEFVGLENYRALFGDGFYWLSLKNTLFYLLMATGMTLILSLFIAYAFFTLRPLQPLVVLLVIPFFLPSASLSALWRAMMGNSSRLVQLLHPRDGSWKFFSLLLLFLWKHIGVAACLILVGLHGINPSVLSAAALDGASKRQLLCKIELPLLRHVITFAIIYLLMNGVRIFRESYLLYGGYPPTNLFFVQHYINGYFARLDYSLLSSAAVVFSHIVLALFYILWSILRKGDCDEQ